MASCISFLFDEKYISALSVFHCSIPINMLGEAFGSETTYV